MAIASTVSRQALNKKTSLDIFWAQSPVIFVTSSTLRLKLLFMSIYTLMITVKDFLFSGF